ncbi:AlpA family transcriptional regulator [uncultured Sphingomonas sp.]|uniref:helix-turn-helix transcriptional regulator n=1 Tax=uncultured Sphingomonas sp. TaxID=158754 RepID=UPI0025D7554C|nr:AlpA family transcriptional regulator [uncultured Sphingomonas sp.]
MRAVSAAKERGRPSDRGRFLRIDDTIATTGLSRATVYRYIKEGDFPKQRQLTRRCVGWWESDVLAWLEARTGAPGAA